LARWKEAKAQGVENYGPMAIKKEFNTIKQEQFPWALEVTKSATEDGFRRLSKTLTNYFDSKVGKRKGERVGFPKFKSKKRARLSFVGMLLAARGLRTGHPGQPQGLPLRNGMTFNCFLY
jgi:putative transposase